MASSCGNIKDLKNIHESLKKVLNALKICHLKCKSVYSFWHGFYINLLISLWYNPKFLKTYIKYYPFNVFLRAK